MSLTDREDQSASKLDKILEDLGSPKFDKIQHDSVSRSKITTLFLWWYFCLIAGSFIFCGVYNFAAAHLNIAIPNNPIKYLEVTTIVSLITSTLSSGLGFVIGYYFKNKQDD